MTDLQPDPDALSGLRGRAGFQAAMRAAARSTVVLYRGNWLLNVLMNDRARVLFALVALHLHFVGKPGLTVAAMKEMCVRLRLCGPARCEAVLALMRAGGLLSAAPDADRRRLLVPTKKLVALQRERWAAYLEAMCLVMPQAEHYCAGLDDEIFVRAFVISLVEKFIAGLRVLDYAPELEVFAACNAGMVILFNLALAGPADGPFPPTVTMPFSLDVQAKTFSVSRKQLLTLLRNAEGRGLVARGGSANEEITLSPRARDSLELLFATTFALLAQCAEDGLWAQRR